MENHLVVWMPTVVVVIGFVAQAAYIKGVFGTKIDEHDRRIGHLEDNVVYRDTCTTRHEDLNRRQGRVETVLNGKLMES